MFGSRGGRLPSLICAGERLTSCSTASVIARAELVRASPWSAARRARRHFPTFPRPRIPATRILRTGFGWASSPGQDTQAIVEKLSGEIDKVLQMPAIQIKLAALDVQPMSMNDKQFAEFVKKELVINTELAKEAGISAE